MIIEGMEVYQLTRFNLIRNEEMRNFILGAGFAICCVIVAWFAWELNQFHPDAVCPQTVMACVH